MYTDDELLPISALVHLIFCERRCALVHVEQLWAENVFTVEGKQLHERAHDGSSESSGSVRITRSLWLKSNRLGLIGQADIVEFHDSGTVTPVEYKRGKPKKDASERVQICAQAMCLEDMLKIEITRGSLFYGMRKRRTDVQLDDALRELTLQKIDRLRTMIDNRETPTARRMPKCDKCSLIELCMPDSQRFRTGVMAWNDRQFSSLDNDLPPETDAFDIALSETELL